MQHRIAKWLQAGGQDGEPFLGTELQCRGSAVDTFDLGDELDENTASEIASDLISLATQHAETEGRVSTYTVIGLTKDGNRERCPIRILPGNVTNREVTKELFGQVKALHEILLKDRQENRRYTELMSKQVEQYAKRQVETLDLMHKLKSEDLKMTIAREEHEHSKEIKERALDVGLPAVVGLVNKLGKAPLLPGGDTKQAALKALVGGFNDEQLDAIERMLEPLGCVDGFKDLCSRALTGAAQPTELEQFVKALPLETQMHIFSLLNVGQKIALDSLTTGNNGQ